MHPIKKTTFISVKCFFQVGTALLISLLCPSCLNNKTNLVLNSNNPTMIITHSCTHTRNAHVHTHARTHATHTHTHATHTYIHTHACHTHRRMHARSTHSLFLSLSSQHCRVFFIPLDFSQCHGFASVISINIFSRWRLRRIHEAKPNTSQHCNQTGHVRCQCW